MSRPNVLGPLWADVSDDEPFGEDQDPETGDRIRTITVDIDKGGKKYKQTQRVRVLQVQKKIPKGVAIRAKWEKFGQAANPITPEMGQLTEVGEPLKLVLSSSSRGGAKEQKEVDQVLQGILRTVDRRDFSSSQAVTEEAGDGSNKYVPGSGGAKAAAEEKLRQSEADQGKEKEGSTTYQAPKKGAGSSQAWGKSAQSPDGCTIKASNLAERTTEPELRDLFSAYGTVTRVRLGIVRETKKSKGYAFITFARRDDAEKAMLQLQRYRLDHMVVTLEWAKPPQGPQATAGGGSLPPPP